MINYTTLKKGATLFDIKEMSLPEKSTFCENCFEINGEFFISLFKYTYKGDNVKTCYIHIFKVSTLDKRDSSFKILKHWREQKDGSFKTV